MARRKTIACCRCNVAALREPCRLRKITFAIAGAKSSAMDEEHSWQAVRSAETLGPHDVERDSGSDVRVFDVAIVNDAVGHRRQLRCRSLLCRSGQDRDEKEDGSSHRCLALYCVMPLGQDAGSIIIT